MRRYGLLLALVIVSWYSFVICFMPKILCDGLPGRVVVAQAALHKHFQQVAAAEQAFGDLDLQPLGWTIVRIDPDIGGDASVRSQNDDTLHALLARPRKNSEYKKPLAERILLLDFSRYEYPIYFLRRDGLFCTAGRNPLQAEQLYVAKDVADAESSGLWDECHMIPTDESRDDSTQ